MTVAKIELAGNRNHRNLYRGLRREYMHSVDTMTVDALKIELRRTHAASAWTAKQYVIDSINLIKLVMGEI